MVPLKNNNGQPWDQHFTIFTKSSTNGTFIMKPLFLCSQCGSPEFINEKGKLIRCAHCGSLYEETEETEKKRPRKRIGTQVVIQDGANVIFGPNADVKIDGDITIETGAKVEILGSLTLIKTA